MRNFLRNNFLRFGFLLVVLIPILFSHVAFSYNESIVSEYNNNLTSTQAFHFTDIADERATFIQDAPYPSYYLYVDENDFGFIMNDGDKDRNLPVKGFYIDYAMHDNQSNGFFGGSLPRMTPFKGEMKLRGVNALTCGKKGFRIQSDSVDVKLKSMCGSVYSLEDKIVSDLLEDKKDMTAGYFLNYPHEIRKVFVNGKFYGIFMTVPKLNDDFLEHNGIEEPDESDQCIFKVYKDFDPKSPLLGSLFLRKGIRSKHQLLGAVELNYGDTGMCLSKLNQLVKVVNQANPNIDDLKEIVSLPSVLFWGLTNISTRNYVSFTHNYLLIYNKGKFSIGNRDAQEFWGCRKTDGQAYQKYRHSSYDAAHRNALFSSVLNRYIDNEPASLPEMQKKVVSVICDASVYRKIKLNDLKYAVFDRFVWNLGHMRKIDYFWNEYVALLEDAYNEKIGFIDFFKKFYNGFDDYFALKNAH